MGEILGEPLILGKTETATGRFHTGRLNSFTCP